ncbi:hypothetical protein VST7929_02022 [Vibrio stylophorae]|uniref:Flagellar protein FlaG n=1 Tax=Vibrio stylophorae TaxID=659351 RepID=A0ABM8ZUX3_9VIBR|nr:flagellar protein FlaG [Vibrio stylophorae]CAH0534121.1 hypothetical protein VST7929_02022 [Vibrio stylophorae]
MDKSASIAPAIPSQAQGTGTNIAVNNRQSDRQPDGLRSSVSGHLPLQQRPPLEALAALKASDPIAHAEAVTGKAKAAELLDERQQAQQERMSLIVSRMDDFLSSINKGLAFRIDEESGRQVVTIFEVQSGDVIRQIPEQEMLDIANELARHASALVRTKV